MTHTACRTIIQNVCDNVEIHFRWNGGSQSDMLVMVVQMPTGFQPDNDYLKKEDIVKRYETNGRNLNLYFDGVVRNFEIESCQLMQR